MKLDLQGFTKRFGDTTVIDGLDLSVGDGEMLALLGPSGCGKSTTLFAICGIHRVDGGRILFGDRDVSGVKAQDRNVGVVFQNYALYPHMTVAENIAFPLTVKRRPADEIKRKVGEMADLVHIPELLKRRPAQLSGGQQQRVALARALVREPDILLLDEPLANLDAKLRMEMRSEIRRVQLETGITAILVTHDQVEAMSMCDRIALMNKGHIVQISKPADMYDDPADMFVAGFLGNPPIAFLDGVADRDGLRLSGGQILPVPERLRGLGPMVIGVRPENFGPAHGRQLTGSVKMVETHGREDLFEVELGGGGRLRAILPAGSGVALGQAIEWGVATDRMLAFSPDGARL
ncbi:MAG: ABC transporter ATP-binding protein [Pseudomonadota bacterium]